MLRRPGGVLLWPLDPRGTLGNCCPKKKLEFFAVVVVVVVVLTVAAKS